MLVVNFYQTNSQILRWERRTAYPPENRIFTRIIMYPLVYYGIDAIMYAEASVPKMGG